MPNVPGAVLAHYADLPIADCLDPPKSFRKCPYNGLMTTTGHLPQWKIEMKIDQLFKRTQQNLMKPRPIEFIGSSVICILCLWNMLINCKDDRGRYRKTELGLIPTMNHSLVLMLKSWTTIHRSI